MSTIAKIISHYENLWKYEIKIFFKDERFEDFMKMKDE